jgi:hypothetical protein
VRVYSIFVARSRFSSEYTAATTLRFVLQAASAPAAQRLPSGGNLNDFA